MANIEDVVGYAFGPVRTASLKAKQRDAKRAMQRQQQYFDLMNFEPQYATQRAQSPQARAWLESYLAGNNPDATFSTDPNAQFKKQAAQASKDQMFGTNQQLIQQGQDLRNKPFEPVELPQETLHNPTPTRAAAAGVPQSIIDQNPGLDYDTYVMLSKNPQLLNDPFFKKAGSGHGAKVRK